MGKENLKKLHKPFIKRVGWKRQLLSQLEKFYPENFNTYFESDEDYKSLSDKAFDVLAKGETSLDEIYSILLNI